MPQAPITIFTGVPRSGTTMLGDLANRYLNIGCANEGPFELWLADAVNDNSELQNDSVFEDLLHELARHQYFTLVFRGTISPDDVVARLRPHIAERTIASIGRAVLQTTADYLERPGLGHEDPLIIDDLSKTLRIFPDCQLVQIIRDPRDVALSILKFPWGANNPTVAADDWNRKVRQTRALGRDLGPDRYHELRYEDLLQTPRETMGALMQFVHGSIDESLLDAYVSETEANPLRSNSGKWTKAFSQRDLQRIEACAADQMEAVGYGRVTSARRMSAITRGFWRWHHRGTQVSRILRKKLEPNGQAILEIGPA
ncbi:MAG: sulfotransferase [Planctomycetota bacterium]|jgi:hypothetical protein